MNNVNDKAWGEDKDRSNTHLVAPMYPIAVKGQAVTPIGQIRVAETATGPGCLAYIEAGPRFRSTAAV